MFSQESSIHGLNFVGERRLHIVERYYILHVFGSSNVYKFYASSCDRNRILWLMIVCLFALIACNVAVRHWYRYENNATVLSLETGYRSWHYPLFGITVCSNYTDDEAITAIVETQWNISKGHASYAYYDDFVRTIATTTYHSLHMYRRYAADETVQDVDMLNVIRAVRGKYFEGLNRNEFSPIITEFGVCYTNGYFRNNLRRNPHFATDVLKAAHNEPRFMYTDVMGMSISPYELDKSSNITIVSRLQSGCAMTILHRRFVLVHSQ